MKRLLTKKQMIEPLKLFNEKADRLQACRFVKDFERNSCFTIESTVGQPLKVTRVGPDQDAIDAFVLTIRFFIQDNETSSFRNFATMYKSPVIPKKLKDSFDITRKIFNSYLDSPAPFRINRKVLTHRDIFDTFIFGGLAHSHRLKKERYDGWMNLPVIAALLTNEFALIMYRVMLIIQEVKRINGELLKVFEGAQTPC